MTATATNAHGLTSSCRPSYGPILAEIPWKSGQTLRRHTGVLSGKSRNFSCGSFISTLSRMRIATHYQVAYLWCPKNYGLPGLRVHCIGAASFRKRRDTQVLAWVWIHPFFRRQGLLTAAWPSMAISRLKHRFRRRWTVSWRQRGAYR